MAIADQENSRSYILSGAGETIPFDLPINSERDLNLYLNGALLSSIDYVIVSYKENEGADIELSSGIGALDDELLIERIVDLTQQRIFPQGGSLPSKEIEAGLDKLTMIDQQQQEELGRTSKLPPGETATELPAAADRAGLFRRFDPTTGEEVFLTPSETLSVLEVEFPGAAFDRPPAVYATKQLKEAATPAFEGQVEVVTEDAAALKPLDAISFATGTTTGARTQTAREHADSLYLPLIENSSIRSSTQEAAALDVPRTPRVFYGGGALNSIPGLVEAVNVTEEPGGGLRFYGDSYLVFEDEFIGIRMANGFRLVLDADISIPSSSQALLSLSSSVDTTKVEVMVGGVYGDANDTRTQETGTFSTYLRGTQNSFSDNINDWSGVVASGRQKIELDYKSNFDVAIAPVSSLSIDGVQQATTAPISGSVHGLQRISGGRFYFGIGTDSGLVTHGTGFVGVLYGFELDTDASVRMVRYPVPVAERKELTFPGWGLPTIDCNDSGNVIVAMQRKNDSLADHGYISGSISVASHWGSYFSDPVIFADDAAYSYQNFCTWWSASEQLWKILCNRMAAADSETELREGTNSEPAEMHLAKISAEGEVIQEATRIPALDQANNPGGTWLLTTPSRAIVLKNGANAGRVVVATWGYATTLNASYRVVLLTSDDDGATWSYAAEGANGSSMNEVSMEELDDGTIVLSGRQNSGYRRVCYSYDGGDTLTSPFVHWGFRSNPIHSGLCLLNGTLYASTPIYGELLNSGGNGRETLGIQEISISGSGSSTVLDPGRKFTDTSLEGEKAAYSNIVATPDGKLITAYEHENNTTDDVLFEFRENVSVFVTEPTDQYEGLTTSTIEDRAEILGAYQGSMASIGAPLRLWLQAGGNQTNAGIPVTEIGSPIDAIVSGGNETTAASFSGSGAIVSSASAHGISYRGEFLSTNAQVPNQFDFAILAVVEIYNRLMSHVSSGNAISSTEGVHIFTESDGRIIVRGNDAGTPFAQYYPSLPPGLALITLELDTSAGTIRGRLNGSNAGWLPGAGDSSVTIDTFSPGANITREGSLIVRDFSEVVFLKAHSSANRDTAEAELAARHGITLL